MTDERLAARTREELLRRNAILTDLFDREAARLAEASREMSRRFLAGGRLFAFGRGAAATDAQHVSVEFVHPVIVGKRALPTVDLGAGFEAGLPALLRPDDMVMGFAFPGPDPEVQRVLGTARERGALTFALAGEEANYSFSPPDPDPFVCQEVFEVLYHVLWETVHVFFEHREQGHDVGAAAFLYPFLGRDEQPLGNVTGEVQESMLRKAAEVCRLRTEIAGSAGAEIAAIAEAVVERLEWGGKIIAFGNGGSATDANDFAIDCLAPPPGLAPIPAVSLAAEPANVTAIANDVGSEAIFARQLIAHARAEDVVLAITTSGDSANILAGLAEARRRGLLTLALAGCGGGTLARESRADHSLVVRTDYIPRIQEVHASLYHALRRRIDERLKRE